MEQKPHMRQEASAKGQVYDLLLRNGTVVDGSGKARFKADVAVVGDRIVEVGVLEGALAHHEIDAEGLIVAPGFIDSHTHDDRLVLKDPLVEPKITQGVTTVVTGNCGISLAPVSFEGEVPLPLNLIGNRPSYFFPQFAAYLAAVERAAPCVNVVPMVGHMTLRAAAGVDPGGSATDQEIGLMKALLAEAFQSGAVGLSTGLAYPFSRNASSDEIVALAEVAAEYGAVYATHMRDEGQSVLDSIDESVHSAKRAGVRLIISHLKCAGSSAWGLSGRALEAISEAAKTQEIAFDAYPYTASSTVLLAEKLPYARETLIAWSSTHPEVAGRSVASVAADWECSQEEVVERVSPAGAIYKNMDEADVRHILKSPLCMIASDGLPHDTHPHPRLWGTFPRILGKYVREVRIFTLEEAVRRMTGFPAAQFGLDGRGVIKAGHYADLCVFDERTVLDCADFDQPTLPAVGIVHVIVNGSPVLTNGIPAPRNSDSGPGRAILGTGSRKQSFGTGSRQ